MSAICNICRKEVENPWMLDGWKPVCQLCFDAFRAGTQAQVTPKKVTQDHPAEPNLKPRGIEALSPGSEPYVILYPEDASLLDSQPQPWRALWEKSSIKRNLDIEKAWPESWAELPEAPPAAGEEE